MNKMILSAALGLCFVVTGCVSTSGYEDLATRVENEQELNEQLKKELVRYQTNVGELQNENQKLATALKKKPKVITTEVEVERIVHVPVEVDTSVLDAELAELRKELEGGLGSDFAFLEADHAVGVRLDDGTAVLFNSGSWELTASAKQSLKVLAEIVKDSLNRHPDYFLRIDGHTDSDPVRRLKEKGIEDNMHLSFKRAKAVHDYVISQGVPAKKVLVLSNGERLSISNEKKLNRRVELWVSTPEGFSLSGSRREDASVSK